MLVRPIRAISAAYEYIESYLFALGFVAYLYLFVTATERKAWWTLLKAYDEWLDERGVK